MGRRYAAGDGFYVDNYVFRCAWCDKETCQGQCRDRAPASRHVGLAVKLTKEEAGKLRERLASGEQITVRRKGAVMESVSKSRRVADDRARRYFVGWDVIKRNCGSVVGTTEEVVEVWAYDARDAAFQVGEPLGGFKMDGWPRLRFVRAATNNRAERGRDGDSD